MSGHVMSGQVRSGQVRSGQVRSGQVRSSQICFLWKQSLESSFILSIFRYRHYPIGVLFDLYASSDTLPWNITVHFKVC